MTAPTPPAPGAPASGEPTGQAPAATQPPATPPAPQQTGQAPNQQPADSKTDLSTLPADVRKVLDDLRAENARHRTDKQTSAQQAQAAKEQRDAVLAAFGLTPDGKDAPPNPDALAAQIADLKAVAWENGAQAAIVRVAGAAGADADALLDSNSFLDSLEGFVSDDPTTADFRTKMQAHIKAFVEKNAKFKTASAGPARSGGDHPGGAGPSSNRSTSLSAAVKKSLGG